MQFMRKLSATFTAVLLLAVPSTAAFAQDPTVRGYPEADVLGEVGTVEAPQEPRQVQQNNQAAPAAEAAPTATPVAASGDSLPFTGLEVGLVALMGAALFGTGLALRRASSQQP